MRFGVPTKLVKFYNLNAGDVFLTDNVHGDCHLYMVLQREFQLVQDYNAVCLSDGSLTKFLRIQKVQKVRGCVVAKTAYIREVIGV